MNDPTTPRTPSFTFGFVSALVIAVVLGFLFGLRPITEENQTLALAAISGLFDSLFYAILFWYYGKKHPHMLFWVLSVALGFSVGDGIQDLMREAPWWYAAASTMVRVVASVACYQYFLSATKKSGGGNPG